MAVETVQANGVELAIHRWDPPAPKALLFYVHGLQSHGGWLFETGPALAERGILLYAVDRRGSGLSGGPRGDTPGCDAWIDDYRAALQLIRQRHPDLPLTIMGQSMGGSLVTGLITRGVEYDALVLGAPSLNQIHSKLSLEQLRARQANRSEVRQPVTLPDEAYTSDPRFLELMKNDPLMARSVSGRLNAAVVDLEDLYMAPGNRFPRRPTALVVPRKDAIINLAECKRVFAELTQGDGVTVEFPSDDHYLEFSRARGQLWAFLASFVSGPGFGLPR